VTKVKRNQILKTLFEMYRKTFRTKPRKWGYEKNWSGMYVFVEGTIYQFTRVYIEVNIKDMKLIAYHRMPNDGLHPICECEYEEAQKCFDKVDEQARKWYEFRQKVLNNIDKFAKLLGRLYILTFKDYYGAEIQYTHGKMFWSLNDNITIYTKYGDIKLESE